MKARGRARVLVDSTFATPVNSRPLDFGVDLVVHSATKYLAGHNDVLGGVAVGPNHIVSLLRDARSVFGSVLDPHAAFLIIRGLKTLAVRVGRQNETALAVARALEAHPLIERVYYPMLESHSSHTVARAQMRGGGGIVSFIVKGGPVSGVSGRRRLPYGQNCRVVRRCGNIDRAARNHELFRALRRAARRDRHRSGAGPA